MNVGDENRKSVTDDKSSDETREQSRRFIEKVERRLDGKKMMMNVGKQDRKKRREDVGRERFARAKSGLVFLLIPEEGREVLMT